VSENSGVILRTVESGFFNAPPKAHPSNVYVVSYNNGRIRAFSGTPSAADRWGSRYCYIVDTAERRVQGSFEVPTAVDAYTFSIEAEATWKVTDPQAVVRANLSNGNDVVLGRLQDDLWIVGRRYRPEDAAGAEIEARSALTGMRQLDEGLTVLRVSVRIRVDRRLTGAVLERDRDTHQANRNEQKMLWLRRMVEGRDDGVVLLHLIEHPDDTGMVLKMMTDARDRNESVQLSLLDRMLEHNLISDADAQPLRDRVLGQVITPSAPMRPIDSRGSSAPASPRALPTSAIQVPTQPGALDEESRQEPTEAIAQTSSSGSASQTPPAAPPGTGGVKNWKSLRKKPDRESE
jgi:hypothetical protein